MSICPICESTQQRLCFKTSLPDKKNTDLVLPYYSSYRLYHCDSCDHYYVYLDEDDRRKLEDYYINRTKEFLDEKGELFSYLRGDYPGSENKESMKRYQSIYDHFIKEFSKKSYILDFGCNQGGFLHFLYKQGFRNLVGVDIDKCALELARLKYGSLIQFLEISEFKNRNELSFDLIVLDQVMEHIVDPKSLIKWLNSCLKPNGYFVVSVPDINRYFEYEYIPCHSLVMLEHIHHYTEFSLSVLFRQDVAFCHSFYRHDGRSQPNFVLPIMSTKFSKIKEDTNVKNCTKTKICEKLSFAENKAKKLIERIYQKTSLENRPVIFWGASRELSFLFFPLLDKIPKAFLVDRNPKKQGKTIAGLEILSPDVLFQTSPELVRDSILLITAVGYESDIYKEALQIGFSEDRIVRPSEIWKEMA